MHFSNTLKRALTGAAALSVLSSIAPCASYAEQQRTSQAITFSIAPASLGEVLREFSAQSGIPVLFSETLVAGRESPGLAGAFTPEAALELLLEGTGLEAATGPEEARIIRARPTPPQPVMPSPTGIERREAPEREPVEKESGEGQGEVLRAETITITGTSLRGIAPESSPLFVYGREEILNSGASTTEQFIRSLPQNFGGGSTEFAPGGLPDDFNSGKNNTLGTGANLRGLGSGGTLVLLNGNRVAPTSTVGDFVDLSLIPVSALDRVDVLTDGASAIYGGDAVAGVINFVLRDDFEGAETSLRYGGVTRGDLDELRASQTFGTAWGSGNVLATYEYFDRDNLTLADRPDIAAPATSGGAVIGDRDRFDILPGQHRDSALLAVNQQIAPSLRFSGSGLYSKREAESTTILAGVTSLLQESDSASENLSLAGDFGYELSPDWSVRLKAAYSQILNSQHFVQYPLAGVPGTGYRVKSRSDLWSADLLANGTLMHLPGGDVRVAIGGHYREERFSSRVAGSAPTRDGDRRVSSVYTELLVPIVGAPNAARGLKRLELSLSGRMDDYSDFGTSSNPKIGLLWSPATDLNIRGSYSTSFAPPALGYVGALDRGAIIVPYAYMTAIYGVALPDPSLDVDMMFVSGTDTDLDPEESRTFTAGVDYTVRRGPHSWSLNSTYYDISFDGRLGQTPVPGNVNWYIAPNIAWEDASAFPEGTIAFFPGADEVQESADALSYPPILYLGGSLDNVGIINRVNLVRNLASTNTRGIDLQLSYAFDTGTGRFLAGINANDILEFTRQAAMTTPEVSVVDTFLNPVDLKLRGNLGYVRGGFTGNLYVNYTDNYRTDRTQASQPVSSWTTADLNLSYAFDGRQNAWLGGVYAGLSVTNLFDKAPPATPTLGTSLISGYDPANASPLGRFIAIELRKTF